MTPLQEYLFGPEFVSSVTALGAPMRQKVIKACVDVLTDRAWTSEGRQLRTFRRSAADPRQLVRNDGAHTWRCNIEVNTPAAARLMLWTHPDRAVEFARAALHDDTTIR